MPRQMYASNMFNLVEDTWDEESKAVRARSRERYSPRLRALPTAGQLFTRPSKILSRGRTDMSGAEYLLFILMLSIFLGFELINKVPATLHTPLMSGANAISGITVVGAVALAGTGSETMAMWLGVGAVTLARCNVVGGYMVTDRMLGFFKKKED